MEFICACVGFPCVFTFSPTHHSHTGRATPKEATAKRASGAHLIHTGLYWCLFTQLFIFLFGVPTGLFSISWVFALIMSPGALVLVSTQLPWFGLHFCWCILIGQCHTVQGHISC